MYLNYIFVYLFVYMIHPIWTFHSDKSSSVITIPCIDAITCFRVAHVDGDELLLKLLQ